MLSTLNILTALAESTPTQRLEILRAHVGNPILKAALRLALDPRFTVGLRKLPEPDAPCKPYPATLGEALDRLEFTVEASLYGPNSAALKLFIRDLLLSLPSPDREVLRRVILKDMSCGVGPKLALTVWPALFPTLDYCGARPMRHLDKDIVYPCIAQRKESGCAVYVYLNYPGMDKAVCAYNPRTATPYSLPCELETALTVAVEAGSFSGGRVLCCEGLAYAPASDEGGSCVALAEQATIGAWNAGDDSVTRVLSCYDIYSPDNPDLPFETRLIWAGLAEEAISSPLFFNTAWWLCPSRDFADALFNKTLDEGGEGLVLKNMGAIWANGKPKGYVKMKSEKDCTLRVVGLVPHTKEATKIGALVCQLDATPGTEFTVEVGSGLNAKDRDNWDLVGELIDVKYYTLSDTGKSLMQPRFLRVRTDLKTTSPYKEL